MDWKEFWQEVKRNSFFWTLLVPEEEWNKSSPRNRLVSLLLAVLLVMGIFFLLRNF